MADVHGQEGYNALEEFILCLSNEDVGLTIIVQEILVEKVKEDSHVATLIFV